MVAIPSRYEGLPLVLLEAMLSGCAIVATGVGSILDAMQDGETGLLVPVDDDEALAIALRRLRTDPELRRKPRRCSRRPCPAAIHGGGDGPGVRTAVRGDLGVPDDRQGVYEVIGSVRTESHIGPRRDRLGAVVLPPRR